MTASVATVPRETSAIAHLPVDAIDVGPNIRIDPGSLDELAANIKELGVLQPVRAVGPNADGRYRLVWGQRRLMASRLAGVATIPTIVDVAADELDKPGAVRSIEQLSENLQRADLNPIEEAVALREVLEGNEGMTQAELARRLGRSAPWVSNTLDLLSFAPEVQEHLREGRLTPSHVKPLRGLAPKTQTALAKTALERGYSAHGVETLVQQHKRDAEWQREREKQTREQARARQEARAAAIAKLATKKVPTDAPIRVVPYSTEGAPIVDLVKKAGYTNVKAERGIASKAQARDCDCGAWKVEERWDGGLSIAPGCISPTHQQAKSRSDDEKRQRDYQLEKAVQAKLAEMLPAEVAAKPASVFVMRALLWNVLDWHLGDWSKEHGGKQNDPWSTIAGLDEAALAQELGAQLAKHFKNHFSYKLPWELFAQQLGIPVEVELPAKRGKKGRGSVKLGRPAMDFWSRVEKSDAPDGCWLWTGPVNPKGYGVVWFEGRARRAHQVAYQLTNGPIPDGHSACHSCDVRRCVKPLHLFTALQAANVADMDAKGRARRIPPPAETRPRDDAHWTRRQPERVLRGQRNGRAKLTDSQVAEIRTRYAASQVSQRILARQYGVSRSRIGQIVAVVP